LLKKLLSTKSHFLISGAPEGRDAMVLGDAVYAAPGRVLLHVARDDARMARLADVVAFFHPDIDCLQFPAWDCLPYDRVSPNGAIVSQRMEVLSRLDQFEAPPEAGGRLVITTINAALQRTPPRDSLSGARLVITRRGRAPMDSLIGFLELNGYVRSGTVTEPGDYAPRGGLLDIFPPGAAAPYRIDLFGDQVDSIRAFDPLTQRSAESVGSLLLTMVTEFRMDEGSVARFREGYRELFGAMTGDDPLYEAVCAGRRHIGMEHWLPLFHERMETLFDYVGEAPVSLDPLLDEARESRLSAIADYYETRSKASRTQGLTEGVYRPLPPERLYLDDAEWLRRIGCRAVAEFTPFNAPGSQETVRFEAGGRPSRDFAAERADPKISLFDALRDYIKQELDPGQEKRQKRLLVACYSEGSRDRLAGVLADHGVEEVARPDGWAAAQALSSAATALVVLGLDHGFESDDLVVLSEQDILGDRLARRPRRARRVEDFIAEASHLEIDDIVVHMDHGIGRFDGLETIELSGARHDCLRLFYDGDDKLYVPVENIEMLSRYGSSDAVVQLDRLGGVAWQARKARLKEHIKEMAGELLRVAAERHLRPGDKMTPPEGLYEEFSARFPYMETEDQSRAIEDVIGDLASGRPMDRLICGDVGFGKTEVAMRAAFVAVMAGRQVAIVVPTTLLCRQHYASFIERFQGLPVRIGQLSRLVTSKQASETKQGMADGQVDIVIGTHALLGKSIAFKRLGLLVIDEEQHFGVAHKERLKKLRSDVHVLTLTATPIPRTMQMALTGVRELSLMATPPIDRLAVRSFIMPYDPVVVREALLREHFRGGQSFFVCPRVSEIGPAAERLAELVPEVRIAIAHGKLGPRELEDVMNAFYDRSYDVLISTAIIESGLDIPSVNTLIVHRAHMFGLSQLYQLRGRIGRSKLRAYAYFTLPPHGGMTNAATKRLEVLHKLDSLGAGFSLASHDLDIRGAGNLLGAEQSGHIREVGLELFQHMLEEAVRAARASSEGGEGAEPPEAEWTPQINVGAAILIPEDYVTDLGVRLALYRRLGMLESRAEIDGFAAELIDRFGPLPELVENLLEVMTIKRLCRDAGVASVEAGATGAVLSFFEDRFANPAGLVAFIGNQTVGTKLRADHSLLIPGDWGEAVARLKGVREILTGLAEVAQAGG
jgi:transcription-repair coupling factor (superfamily II helicase)